MSSAKPGEVPPQLPAIPPDPVAQVFKWVVDGQSESDIRESLAVLVPAADATKVLTAVMERMRQAAEADAGVVFGWAVEATREVYRRMMETGDYAGALRAVKQLNDMVSKHVHDRSEAETQEPRTVEADEG